MIFSRLIIFVIILGLSACQSSGVQKQKERDIEKRAALHYSLGIDALHKGLLPKAFEELLLSDSISPKNSETLDAIAYSWRLRGNNKEAVKYYKQAIRYEAGPATLNNYGSLLVELGDYKNAVKQLNLALEDPRYSKQELAFINLGDALIGLKDFEGSIAAYRKAQMLSPNWSYPKLREAAAYVDFNRLNYAQALYETVLRQDPTNQQALFGLIKLPNNTNNAGLKKYIQKFMNKTTDPLQKAWAKDELAQLSKR